MRLVRTVDRRLYRERNRIERFFNLLKHLRGIATRYFKTATNVLAALHLASARLRSGSLSPRVAGQRAPGLVNALPHAPPPEAPPMAV